MAVIGLEKSIEQRIRFIGNKSIHGNMIGIKKHLPVGMLKLGIHNRIVFVRSANHLNTQKNEVNTSTPKPFL